MKGEAERDRDLNCGCGDGQEKRDFIKPHCLTCCVNPCDAPLRKSAEKILFKKKLLKLDLCFDS